MEAIFFWIAWGIISIWTLRTFYYSFSKEKLEKLRKTSIGLTTSVLVLTLLPWLPLDLGGSSAVVLALEGIGAASILLVLLIVSLILFFQKEYVFLKTASVLSVIATLDLFALMVIIRPATFTLSLYDIAPIVAVLILLILDVVVLLLWKQMQFNKKDKAVPTIRKKIVLAAISLVISVSGITISYFGILPQSYDYSSDNEETIMENEEEELFEAFPKQKPGIVCAGGNQFSFRINSQYSVLEDYNSGIVLVTDSGLLTVTQDIDNLEKKLTELKLDFTKSIDIYSYEVKENGGGTADDTPIFGLSQQKDGFTVSVFYESGVEEGASKLLLEITESLNTSCLKNE